MSTNTQLTDQEIESQLISGRSLEEKLDICPVEILLRSPDFQIISTYRFYLTPWEIAVIPVGLVKTEQVAGLIMDLREASFYNVKMKRANEVSKGKIPLGVHWAVGLMKALDEVKPVELPNTAYKYSHLNIRLLETPKY